MNARERRRETGVAMVLAAAACWSTAGVWITFIVARSGISAIDLAFWRDLVTFVLLLAGVLLIRPGLLSVRRRDLPWLALMGAVGIGAFHALWNLSALLNGAAIATILQYNAPIIVTLSAWFVWREPLTLRKVLAILLALSGTILIAVPGAAGGMEVTMAGLLVGLASALSISVYSLVGKRLSGSYSPWTIVTYVFGFATLALLPFALFTGPEWTPSAPVLAAFAGFVLIPTIGGFSIYVMGLQRLQVSVAAIVATAEVLFASIWAYLLLGERLDSWQWLGMALVISGVFLVSLPRSWRMRALSRKRAASS